MGVPVNLIVSGLTTILGGLSSGSSQMKAGDAAYRLSVVNAESILRTSELNAQLIEAGSEENAGIAEFNARLSEAKARDAIVRGRQDEQKFRTRIRTLVGSQKASYAGSGVDVGFGSSIDVQTDTAYQGDLDAQVIRTNAAREAWGFTTDAESDRLQAASIRRLGKQQAGNTREIGRSQALSERMQGDYAKSAGKSAGLSTILTAAGKMVNDISTYKRRKP